MSVPTDFITQLHAWYATPAGRTLADELSHSLAQLLPPLFGYYALQVGTLADDLDLLRDSTINRKIYMAMTTNSTTTTTTTTTSPQHNLITSPLALPFPQDTLDLIVLPHTLDFSRSPHRVLRETYRALIPDGHLVLIGFNPVSMMGLTKLALFHSRRVPWAGHFYTARRLEDWLSLLDFTVVNIVHIGLRPPLQNLRLQQRLAFLAKADRCGLTAALGGLHIFVAQKRLLTLTPRPKPRPAHRRIFPINVAEPTTRTQHPAGKRHDNHVRTHYHLH